ncbi:DsbA family protein, partial [Patescibacteria group bacterium]|nr:DsbA family protein [Patescibacteria group bacterium]
PLLARIFNKYFELLSWIFVILSILSIVWVGNGIWNYYAYGSCNGLNASGFCVFDPSGKNNQISAIGEECFVEAPKESDLSLEHTDLSLFVDKNPGAKNNIVFIGCYSCDYTREIYPLVKRLINNDVHYTFIHFPVKSETEYLTGYGYCIQQEDEERFWQFNDIIFASEKSVITNPDYAGSVVKSLGLDIEAIKKCAESQETKNAVFEMLEETKQTGIYGTPTIFINGKAFVGPKPLRVYRRAIKK